jgi:hypothetical protein
MGENVWELKKEVSLVRGNLLESNEMRYVMGLISWIDRPST